MPPKYKPGGKRFTPRVSSKPLPKQVFIDNSPAASSSSASDQASSGLDEQAENQFELELCWCIQQLQINLDSGKLAEKQMLDTTKNLNLLKSNTVALIRKRQIMRNTFGDYRAKMVQDEKKHGKYISNVKFSAPKPSSGKSLFLKKAAVGSGQQNTSDKDANGTTNLDESTIKKTFVMRKDPSNVPFTFNFSEPELK